MRNFSIQGRAVAISHREFDQFQGVARGGLLLVETGESDIDLKITSWSRQGFDRSPNVPDIAAMVRRGIFSVAEVSGRKQIALTPLGKAAAERIGCYSLSCLVRGPALGEDAAPAPAPVETDYQPFELDADGEVVAETQGPPEPPPVVPFPAWADGENSFVAQAPKFALYAANPGGEHKHHYWLGDSMEDAQAFYASELQGKPDVEGIEFVLVDNENHMWWIVRPDDAEAEGQVFVRIDADHPMVLAGESTVEEPPVVDEPPAEVPTEDADPEPEPEPEPEPAADPEPEPEPEVVEPEPTPEFPPANAKLKDLQAFADKHGVDHEGLRSKAKVRAAIEAHFAS